MKHASFLTHLRFDKKLADSVQAKYLRNPRLLVLILAMIFSFGIFSYFNLPRRLFPEIKIPLVIISTPFPGASPSEVESLVTDPLEDSLGSVSNIKTYTSSSRDSFSVIQVEFNSGVDADKAAGDVKTVVDNVSIPKDAIDPTTTKVDFEQFPVWSFSLISKSEDTASLIEFSKRLKDRIEEIPTVDRVGISGLEEQEIQITIKPESLSTYGFNPQVLMSAITNATKSLPAGTVRTEASSFTLSVDPLISSIEDIRDIRIHVNGSIVNLSDIATVSFRSKPNQLQSFIAQPGLPARIAVSFSIFKTANADISKTVEVAREEINLALGDYGNEFSIFTTSDISEQIDNQFNELIRDFIVTIILVFIALLVFLGIRQAVVASLSIPLTFLISFGIMNIFGVALSFISFFSLLLALGLVVDDTIVVISAMTAYFRSGKFTPFQTGLLVWRDFITPILTTTLTTVWAFVPLLLSTGIIGEFIKPIPIVVSTTLLASFLVAMFITLPIVTFLFKPTLPKRVAVLLMVIAIFVIFLFIFAISPKNILLLPILIALTILLFTTYKVKDDLVEKVKGHDFIKNKNVKYYLTHGIISFEPLSIRYQLFIRKILSHKRWVKITVTLVVIFSIFSYLLVPLGLVKNEFFPRENAETVSITVELPAGTNLETSKKEALSILEKLRNEKDVETVSVNLGQASGVFGEAAGATANSFLYTLVLKEERSRQSSQVTRDLRKEFKDYSKGKLSVLEQSGGPPAGADIQINISGPDLAVLDEYADKVITYLKSQPGTANVDKSIKPGTSKIAFSPNRQKLSENSITADQIGFTLRTFASGFELDSVKLDPSSNEEQDITLRFVSGEQFVESISSLMIPTQSGNIPLLSLGSLTLETSPTLITREDGKRTISVTASVETGYAIADVNMDLQNYANTDFNLPSGYLWKTGGVNEENQESINSVLIAMVVSFVLILITMVLQFNSFRKAFIIILVIPLSISGVFIIFGLTNTYLSFPGLVGVLALFGIVVKNSILIVDKIQANQKTKMSFEEAIAEGAASRLEPIALTSLTAILGLIPITISDPLWRGLGGAIIAGLTFSGTIMLFFIPVVYFLIFRSSARKQLSSRR
ncbi:MAG: efflux RND transporter permease subunit [Candidatus Levybacteria bacterium]|nr:efflux RND transporter permease subunit [Candidatus Levybacteria bacterium]